MDKKVTDAHVTKIAALLSRWNVAAKLHVLGLDDEIAKDIEDRYRNGEDQRSEALMKWVRKQSPQATYGILYDVLQEMEEADAAEMVMKLTKGNYFLDADWIRGSAHAYRNARLSKGHIYTCAHKVTHIHVHAHSKSAQSL